MWDSAVDPIDNAFQIALTLTSIDRESLQKMNLTKLRYHPNSGSNPATSVEHYRASGRKPLVATIAAAGMLAAMMVPAISAQAATTDSLNVGFNGSLVGTTAYTTTGDEKMHGVLRRLNGAEEQIAQAGVKLAGGSHGIRYDATDLDLGTTQAENGFLGEVKFTPTASNDMATIFSAGGNFYVRSQAGKLRYGFDSRTGTAWSSNMKETAFPALNAEHVISFHYLPASTGTTLTVMLDGENLPPVTTTGQAQNSPGLSSAFGFGTEVNPQGSSRGFTGTLHEIRLAAATAAFTASDFEFQPQPASTSLLDVAYDGTVTGGTYSPVNTETVLGSLSTRAGAEVVSGGKVTLTGNGQSMDFTATDVSLGETTLNKGFVAETVFTPSAGQAQQGTLIGVGGNFFVRYATGGTALEYGYSTNASGRWVDFKQSVPLPAVDKEHVFSIAYVPATDGKVTLFAGLDGQELASVNGTGLSTRSGALTTTAGFGNDVNPGAASRGFKGSLSKSRFATLSGDFRPAAFTYQTLAEIPSEVCEPLELDPANYISVSTADCAENIIAKSTSVRPTLPQLEWQESRQTAFLHFGINTFYNQEWGHGTEDPARFNPTDFDADSWIKNLRDNGFRLAILTVKHHDGFLSYPSRYTDYSVKSSPWEGGKGDVLREVTNAAHKYGMKVGVYMSPADSNQEAFGVFGNGSVKSERTIPTLVEGDDRIGKDLPQFKYQATDYGSFFLNTLYETLTEYGQVDEVWFDGAGGNTAKQELYDYPAFYDMIGKLQPKALVAVGGRDIRWIGNEQGTARQNEWNVIPIKRPDDGGKIGVAAGEQNANLGSRDSLLAAAKNGSANSLHWWPGEADMKLTEGWFAHPNDVPKSPSTMLGKYHDSVGRNSVLLLNVPPTTTGQFAPSSVTALQGFTEERQKSFSVDHALGKPVKVSASTTPLLTDGNLRTGASTGLAAGDSFEIDLGSAQPVDRITLTEDTLNHGQVVEKLKVEAKVNGTWTKVADIGSVGVLRIEKFSSTVTAQEFRVTVVETRAPAYFSDFSLFQQLAAAPAPTLNVYVDCAAPTAGIGTQDRPYNSLEQFRQAEIATGATLHFKAGTNCAGSDTPFWGYGTQEAPITVTSYGTGAAPLIDGKSLSATFAKYAAQGWKVTAEVQPTTPAVTVDQDTVEAGDTLKVSFSGFAPSEEITVELHSAPVGLGSVTPGTDGTAELTVTIPVDTEQGDHSIVGTQGELSALAALAVTVTEPTTDPTMEPTTEPTVDPTTDPTTDPTASASATPPSASTSASATASASASMSPGSAPSQDPNDLANTGSSSTTGIGLALLSLLTGLSLMVLLRRRGKRA